MSWVSDIAPGLPRNWAVTRVSNVADVQFSNVDKHTLDDELPVRLCNYVDVYKNDRITADVPFMDASATASEIERFEIQGGDVLVTKDSETPDDIAIAALVAESLPGILCGYHLAMIRPRSNRVRGEFIYWLHASKEFRGQYEREAVGVTRFGLTQHSFLAACLPLPPVDEQKRIATYLEASCCAIDSAVVAKREQLSRLDELRESIVEDAILGGMDRKARIAAVEQDWIRSTPAHWQVVRIKRVIARMDYGISESTEQEGQFAVLKMGNLQGGEVRFTNIEFVDTVNDALILEPGDILYNRTNSADQVGKAALFTGSRTDKVTFASYLVRLRANHRITPKFLNYVVNSNGFLSFARRLAIPSVQQSNLNSTRYGRMLVPLPTLEEQRAICRHLDEKLAKLNTVVVALEEQIGTLAAYRKSLIHECVIGQRRITEEDVNRVTAHAATLA